MLSRHIHPALRRPAKLLPGLLGTTALIGLASLLGAVPAGADDHGICDDPNAANCSIVANAPQASKGDTGITPGSIDFDFTDPITWVAQPSGPGAIDVDFVSGQGGDAKQANSSIHEGSNGGAGGVGGRIAITVGSGVTAQGSAPGGDSPISLYTAGGVGGAGGSGNELAGSGKGGTGGTGGTGGDIVVQTMDGTIDTNGSNAIGLALQSFGGAGGSGAGTNDADGGDGIYAAYAGAGGPGGTIILNVGGTVKADNTAIYALIQGGAGGAGPNDTEGLSSSIGSDGGKGGTTYNNTVSVTGSITSTNGNGIDVRALGGAGGNGGTAQDASSVDGGDGGAGGNGGTATGAIAGSNGTVTAGSTGLNVLTTGGTGGNGGQANGSDSSGDTGSGGSGGWGGNGGSATANVQGTASASDPTITAATVGASADSSGGAGGDGAQGSASGGTGGGGGQGGIGGPALTQLYGSAQVTSPGIGAQALSNGGAGGTGNIGIGGDATGGDGGAGGQGGSATVSVARGSSVTTTASDAPKTTSTSLPGVLVSSNGGVGGAGGKADAPVGASGGGAGKGGAGGTATASIDGSVTTSGSFATGVLAQSVGGLGGNGGDAKSLFFGQGGVAKNGGLGGAAVVHGNGGTITTTGTGAAAIVGQSIGGGGGTGGNALAVGDGVTVAIGGNGGAGGNGAKVQIGTDPTDSSTSTLDDTLITRGHESTGIIAQSVGGAGGNGGNAVAAGVSVLSLAIGGDGKGGGTGGPVTVTNDGVITTFGLQSGGVAAQSVGGGGGNGGSGVSVSANVMTAAVAIGGTGAGGGPGGAVNLTNNDQITTYGADAYGMKAQSVSGGGGEGGTATAVALAVSPDPEVPAVSVSVGIGGSGGAGGNQSDSPVTITNNGFLATAGDGAIGLFAQNVAGGGGNGGDSTASAYSAGAGEGQGISVSLGVAGKGGAGGTGGPATVTNNALVVTLGESAHGVMAQSVGGGGGVGGIGDTQASNLPSDFNVSTAITVGGHGGSGSQGGTVTVNNNGSIATGGDGARGIYAHSVGGSGGASGGGVAKANAQDLSLGVTVGGNGGTGGNGGEVQVTNTVDLLTRGSDADGIYAQSVGGGGGSAGKGSSTAGGAQSAEQAFTSLTNTLSSGLGLGQGVVKLADGVFKVGDGALKDVNKLSDLEKILPEDDEAVADDDDDDGEATSIKLTATIGGQGGVGGSGDTVTVENSGSVATSGAWSDGIFAQNLGGGGGVGGASSFSGTDGDASGSLTVGASGAGGGNACVDDNCNVTVTNDASGAIATAGVTANGITAQSIGGGGGKGGVTASAKGALKDLTVTLGGSGGKGGAGGPVTVNSYGTVDTAGRHGYGIFAQSTGGGGGIAHVLSSDTSSSASDDDDDISVNVAIGGNGGAGGDGGAVTVDVGQSAVSHVGTKGTGAIGVVAQSVGGGGGLLVTSSADTDDSNTSGLSDATVIPVTIGGASGASGNGGTVQVTLDPTDANHTTGYVQTGGSDAYGVLAQSVGGGGGLVVGGSNPQDALTKLYPGTGRSGDGGSVSVTVNNGFSMGTGGVGSVGVLAQSVGGGGGVIGGMSQVDVTKAIQANPTPQSGQGGNVTVELESGGNITTSGRRAHVIVAQSLGGGGGVIGQTDGSGNVTGYAFAGANPYTGCSGDSCSGSVTVTLGGNTVVRPLGPEAYGVVVQSQGNGVNDTTININGGFIESWAKSAGAIYVAGAGTNTINNTGTIDDGSDTSLPGGPTPNATGVSITGNQPATINNNAGGTINGSITLPNGTSGLNNNGGTYNPGSTIDLGGGKLINRGTINPGNTGRITTTRLHGDLLQLDGGVLQLDTDHSRGAADRLQVNGDVTLAGSVQVNPITLSKAPVTVLTSSGTLTLDPTLTATPSHLFSYSAKSDGAALQVTPHGDFRASEDPLNATHQGLARHLQAVWDQEAEGFGEGFAALSGIDSADDYRDTLDTLSGEAIGAIGVTRLAASQAFVGGMYSCPTFVDDASLLGEADCSWGKVVGSASDRNSDSSSIGYQTKALTIQFGGQKEVAADWFLGGSLAYETSSIDGRHDTADIDGQAGLAGISLKREQGPLTIGGAADFAYGWYDTVRSIDAGGPTQKAKASPNAWNLGLHGRVAYELPMQRWYLRPLLDLHAVYAKLDGYTEHGASAFDLDVDDEDKLVLSAAPALEVGRRVDLSDGTTLRAFASAGVSLSTANNWQTDASFAAAPASAGGFRSELANPNVLGTLTAGVDVVTTKSIDVRLQYNGAVGQEFMANSGMLRVGYRF